MQDFASAETKTDPTNPLVHALTLAFGVVVFLAFGMQLALASMYQGKIFPGVSVAGISVGNLTVTQAQEKLEWAAKDYTISLAVGEKNYKIHSTDLGAKYDQVSTAQAAYMVGRQRFFMPLGLLDAHNKGSIGYAYTLDKNAQKLFVEKVVAETGVAPTNAEVAINNGAFEVRPDKNGTAVNPIDLTKLLEEAVAQTTTITLRLDPKPLPAPVKAGDTAPVVDEAKKILGTPVELTYEGRSFKPSAAEIGQWVVFDTVQEDGKTQLRPRVDEGRVKDYVLRVAHGINKAAINHKVRIENGVSSEERAGVEGLVVDDATVTKQVVQAVSAKKPLLAAIPTKPIAFKTEYNRVVTLDYGRYIEINLSRQRMWVYQDKQVIFETPITSGAAGAGFPTVQGLFSIYNKQTNRNLNGYAIGYNYNVFVKYWMPFSGNFGLHDASWRSAFGGQDYYYGGSHGCVNMPEHAAAFLFDWAPVGTPVWVHS